MGQKIRAAPAAPAPITNRRYGALTPAAPRDRELSFDHVTVPEQGYRSLASKAEVPLSGGGARGLTHILRRVVVGAVFITLSAAAVSTLYGGRASSKSGVGEAGVGYPEMTAEAPRHLQTLGNHTGGGGDGWVPKVRDTWQYNLKTPVDTDVNADVFFINMDGAQTTIDELHGKGKWVSCYISVGTVEAWREDAIAFPPSAVGHAWDDWAGEKYLDITQQIVRDIMQARIEKAAGMNCDAIEPDNMSNWNQDGTGLTITREEQIQYNRWVTETVHENGMKGGMKNAIELLDDLSGFYDFAINEECHEWDECGAYTIPFVNEDKPVFNVEYIVDYGLCDESKAMSIDTIFKEYDVNAALCSCADSSRDVDCSHITR